MPGGGPSPGLSCVAHGLRAGMCGLICGLTVPGPQYSGCWVGGGFNFNILEPYADALLCAQIVPAGIGASK